MLCILIIRVMIISYSLRLHGYHGPAHTSTPCKKPVNLSENYHLMQSQLSATISNNII